MRTEKVLYARCGELELRLEPAPPQSPHVVGPAAPVDDADDERRSLETLLHSSGVDPDIFIRALNRRAA